MKIGFTGTRKGMTTAQHNSFCALLMDLKPTEFHHGACVGADEEAVQVVSVMSHAPVHVVARPGRSAHSDTNELMSKVAISLSQCRCSPMTHFARNRKIVESCEALVATPWQSERQPLGTGGGTWYTIQYAEKLGKPVYFVWPNGKVSAPAAAS